VTKSYEVEEDIEAIEAEYRQVKEAQAKKLEAPKEDAKPSVLGSFM
jgi:hypothetical protein